MRGQMLDKSAEQQQPGREPRGRMGMGRMGMMGRMQRRQGGMGPMGGVGMCPMCGRMMGMGAGQEEGPYRGKGPAKRTDEQIKSGVEEALTADSWLDASGIQVNVQNGIVTLSGTVDSRESKRRAEDFADQVSGVRDVQNNLQIAGL